MIVDRTLIGSTAASQTGTGSNGNEETLNTPPISRTGISSHVSYQDQSHTEIKVDVFYVLLNSYEGSSSKSNRSVLKIISIE